MTYGNNKLTRLIGNVGTMGKKSAPSGWMKKSGPVKKWSARKGPGAKWATRKGPSPWMR